MQRFFWTLGLGSHEQNLRGTLPSLPVGKARVPAGAGAGRLAWCRQVTLDTLGHLSSALAAPPPRKITWRQPNPSAKSLESPTPTAQPWLHLWQSEWQLQGLFLLPFLPSRGVLPKAGGDSTCGGRVAEATWLQVSPPPPLRALLGFLRGGVCGRWEVWRGTWGLGSPGARKRTGGAWGAHLTQDMGTYPLSICRRKWQPQMPESPRHMVTPVYSC